MVKEFNKLTALDSFSSTRTFSILVAKGQDLFSSLNPFMISLVKEVRSPKPSEIHDMMYDQQFSITMTCRNLNI